MKPRREREALRALEILRTGRHPGRHRRGRSAAADQLRNARLFLGLPSKDLTLLARMATPVALAAGTIIVDERRPLPQFFILVTGAAEQTLGGKRIGVLSPGDHFGELTLLEGEPYVPTVTALTDVEGFVFAPHEFWGILHQSPAVSMRFAASLAEHLRRAERRLAAVSTETVSRTALPEQRLSRAASAAAGEPD